MVIIGIFFCFILGSVLLIAKIYLDPFIKTWPKNLIHKNYDLSKSCFVLSAIFFIISFVLILFSTDEVFRRVLSAFFFYLHTRN